MAEDNKNIIKSLSRETKFYRGFFISTTLAVALVLSGIFFGMSVKTRDLIADELLSITKAYYDMIMLTRMWNANHGGIYVEKYEGVESAPILEEFDITTKDGRVFSLRNPAMMTREISEYTQKHGKLSFHITSLKPTHPKNKPDDFERRALLTFEKEEIDEYYETVTAEDKTYYRYIAPLYVSKFCLQCHSHQGYKVGEVRGGISVTMDISGIQEKLRHNTIFIVLFGASTMALLMSLILFFTRLLIRKLTEARQEIEEMATTDALTKLYNRRFLMARFEEEFQRASREKKNLCCILMDIDHFKAVNDTYGHSRGDDILVEVAARLKSATRNYDFVARFGGEEFLVIHIGDIQGCLALAERIRLVIREEKMHGLDIKMSLGVAEIIEADKTVEDLINRADSKLYEAKDSGRDQVKH